MHTCQLQWIEDDNAEGGGVYVVDADDGNDDGVVGAFVDDDNDDVVGNEDASDGTLCYVFVDMLAQINFNLHVKHAMLE